MTISTYAELQSAVKNWLERPDVADARVREFIALFEAYANRQIRHYKQETRTTITIAGRYTSLPADYKAMQRLALEGTSKALIVTNADDLQDMQEKRDFAVGEPTHYAIVGDEIEVFPTPSQSYTATIYYRTRLPALSDSNTTNWLLTEAPEAYLYGSLFHAASFLDFDERLTAFSAPMDAAITQLNIDSDESKFANQGARLKGRFYG